MISTPATALSYALRLISKRDRSVGEIRDRLIRKGFDTQEAEEVISDLKEKRFLNDERFAENFIRNQSNIKPMGKHGLRQKLMRYKVSRDIIEKALENFDTTEENLVYKAADKWIRCKRMDLEDAKSKEKLVRHLVARGFSFDTIMPVIENIVSYDR